MFMKKAKALQTNRTSVDVLARQKNDVISLEKNI